MASTNIGQKFSQTYPNTTLYWHTCKFTGKRFASPFRARVYSAEGERLKREYDQAIKDAAKQISRVYFYYCPVSQRWFTARTPSATTPESKEAARLAMVELSRKRRENGLTKAYEESRKGKRTEYLKTYNEVNKERYAQRAKDKAERAKALMVPKAEPISCDVYFNTCVVTGQLFTAKTSKAKVSREGRLQQGRELSKANRVARHCTCKHCNKSFTPDLTSKQRSYCSDKCRNKVMRIAQRKVKNYRLRAKYYGVAYEPFDIMKIFERDKWRCQLCGIKTPKSKRGTIEPEAPELDHIIPLSRGGSHIIANVHCACRRCNGLKSNKIVGQLTLTI